MYKEKYLLPFYHIQSTVPCPVWLVSKVSEVSLPLVPEVPLVLEVPLVPLVSEVPPVPLVSEVPVVPPVSEVSLGADCCAK